MCTPAVCQCILDVLNDFINSGRVFTAYDVTLEARTKTQDNVKHRDVRDLVLAEYSLGSIFDDYNMDAIELDVVNNPFATVYFPDGKSAQDHPRAFKAKVVAPVVAPTANNDPVVAMNQMVSSLAPDKAPKQGHIKDGNSYICEATIHGEVNLPKELCNMVKDKDRSIDIVINGNIIYKYPQADGRYRLSDSRLGGHKKYRVSVNPTKNTIVVEQV